MKNHIHKTQPVTDVLLFFLAIALIIIPVAGAEGVEVSIQDLSVATGSSLILPISLQNAEELSEANLEISYDPSVLKFTRIELGGISQNGIIEATETKPGTIEVNVADNSGISQDGELMKLSFSVTGAEGTTSPISITSRGFQNLDKNDVPTMTNGGKITVTGPGLKAPMAGYIPAIALFFAIGFFILKGGKLKK